jgi:hypothetical protein
VRVESVGAQVFDGSVQPEILFIDPMNKGTSAFTNRAVTNPDVIEHSVDFKPNPATVT